MGSVSDFATALPKERTKQHIRDRLVYNDWDLYSFVQMLTYMCLRFGKALSIIDERDTTKMCHKCNQNISYV